MIKIFICIWGQGTDAQPQTQKAQRTALNGALVYFEIIAVHGECGGHCHAPIVMKLTSAEAVQLHSSRYCACIGMASRTIEDLHWQLHPEIRLS
jgi:hypothetical protein